MPLNCLIFQDDRKMIANMDQARDIGEMLDCKQPRTNSGKYVVIGTPELRIKLLKEAEKDPIMMGEHKLESSKSEKYLGDWINEEGTSASISDTMNKREGRLKPTT